MSAVDDTLSALFLSDDPSEVQRAIAAVGELSSGHVRKPELINRRTNKPERDGLHCARIFGPTRTLECLCGKLKGPQDNGETCDRCGVLCTDKDLRSERWGHIEVAAPLFHPKLLPTIAVALGCTVKQLLAVLHFEADLHDDGKVVPVRDDASYIEHHQRGPWHLAERLGDRAQSLLLKKLPVTPAAWRGTRSDPQDAAYMRLITRDSRVHRLMELEAPQIILDNEALQAQRAFDKLYEVVGHELRVRGPEIVAPVNARATALLTAIHDDPDADAPRRAYAEYLTDAGDPRGEFIRLQLAGARTSRREADLLRRNYERWLAPFDPATLRATRFRRGFLASCTVAPGAADVKLGDPAWATLEHIETDRVDLISEPVMRGLRSLALGDRALCALAERRWWSPRIDTLQLRLSRCPPPQAERLTDGETLPGVRALTLVHAAARSPQDWSWLAGTPLARQLERLTLALAPERIETLSLAWWVEFLRDHRRLERLDIGLGKHQSVFALRRDGEDVSLRVTVPIEVIHHCNLGYSGPAEALGRCLLALPPDSVTSVRVDCRGGWYTDDLIALARGLRDHFGPATQLPRLA